MAPQPQVRGIEWNQLSLRSREILLHITTPIAAGFEYDEVAARLDRERPEVRHLQWPVPPKAVTKAWVQARSRELRGEIEETGAATY